MNEMYVRCSIAFRVDGLNLEGVKEDLSKYGKITSIDDFEIGDIPVKLIFLRVPFGQYSRLKMDYNCVEPRHFVLFPKESFQDELQILQGYS